MCYYCTVYYLKATFGPGTSDAVLEMPVPATGNNVTLFPSVSFYYQISSPRIELALLQRKAGSTEQKFVLKYWPVSQYQDSEWNKGVVRLDPDVDAFQLVARKTGVTTNADVDCVLVDDIRLELFEHSGKIGYGTAVAQSLLLVRCYLVAMLL